MSILCINYFRFRSIPFRSCHVIFTKVVLCIFSSAIQHNTLKLTMDEYLKRHYVRTKFHSNLWGSSNFLCWFDIYARWESTQEIFPPSIALRLILRPFLGQNTTRSLIYRGKRGYNFSHLNEWSNLWLCFELFRCWSHVFVQQNGARTWVAGHCKFLYPLCEFGKCIRETMRCTSQRKYPWDMRTLCRHNLKHNRQLLA